MKTMLSLALAALWCGAPLGYARDRQDAGPLVDKLKAKDADEADNAEVDLLKLGEAAVKPLRDAVAASDNAAFRKRAGAIADRLETRKGVAGLAKKWGDRWYAVYGKALKMGWAHMKAEEKDGKIIFTDELYVRMSKDQEFTLKATIVCQANEYLAPLEIELESTLPDSPGKMSARVKDGRLIAQRGEERNAAKIKSNTVVDLALMRLVTCVPKTEAYEIGVIELFKPKLRESVTLATSQEESIEYEGRKVKCRRIIQADGENADKFYWVDGEGRLLKFASQGNDGGDQVEIVLEDEKRAKDIDTDK